MYDRIRIVSDRNSSHKLIAMFAAAFEKLTEKQKNTAPAVIYR